jgi:hypothetical protein
VVDVCFELVSDLDWNLGQAVLSTNGKTILATSWGLIDFVSDAEKSNYRCDWVSFPTDSDVDLYAVVITIPRLETSRNEIIDCPAAQSKLEGTGVVIECYQTESSNGYNILSYPEGMLLEQAQALAYDSFLEIIDGPWILEGEVK